MSEEYTEIEKLEEKGIYLSDILIDSKLVTKVKNQGNFSIQEKEGVKTSLIERLSRKNIIYYGIMQGEQTVKIEEANFSFQAPIVQIEQIVKRLSKIKEDDRKKIGYIHLNSVQIIIRSTFREGIKTPLKLIIEDNRIVSQDLKKLGEIDGDLGYGVIKFNVTLQYPIPFFTKRIDNCISISCDFKEKDLMKKGDIPLVVCYQVAYALSNSSLSMNYKHLERLYTDKIFNETSTLIKEDNIHKEFIKSHSRKSISLPIQDREISLVKKLERPLNRYEIGESSQISKIEKQVKELQGVITDISKRI